MPRPRGEQTSLPNSTISTRSTGELLMNRNSRTLCRNDDFARLFDCPVCYEYILPPIQQCESGHLICSRCRTQILNCPVCRIPLTVNQIRNLSMEQAATFFIFPCKYTTNGCTFPLMYNEIQIHEEVCKFRKFECPMPGEKCNWLGTMKEVAKHLKKTHTKHLTARGEVFVCKAQDININNFMRWTKIQIYFGRTFILVVEKTLVEHALKMNAYVLFIGTHAQAEKFVYSLEVVTGANKILIQLRGKQCCTLVESLQPDVMKRKRVSFKPVTIMSANNSTVFTDFNVKFQIKYSRK